jgi:hypothetical protein
MKLDGYTAEEIARLANKGLPLDFTDDLADFQLHTCLAALFQQYRDGLITKEDAAALKARQIAAWRSWKETHAAYKAFTAEWNENIRRASGIEIEKAGTVHEALMLCCEVIGRLTGDTGLRDRIQKKFCE